MGRYHMMFLETSLNKFPRFFVLDKICACANKTWRSSVTGSNSNTSFCKVSACNTDFAQIFYVKSVLTWNIIVTYGKVIRTVPYGTVRYGNSYVGT